MKLKEKLYRRHKVFSGRAVDVSADEIVLPDGKHATREYMEHPGAVAVLPFVDKNRIVLVNQYRYPVDRVTLELPAGKLDGKEHPDRCVRRELEEETGFKAARIIKLLSYWPTPAFSNEVIHVYAAFGLTKTQKSPDEDEFIRSKIMTFGGALKKVRDREIMDSKTIIALLYYEGFRKTGKLRSQR